MTVTRAQFIDAVLEGIDKKLAGQGYRSVQTDVGRLALLTLSVNEYGATSNFGARCNPLDTTQPEPGSWAFNTNGGDPVQNFPTPAEGVTATVATITNGRYDSAISLMGVDYSTPKQLNLAARTVLLNLMMGGWGSINLDLAPQVAAASEQYGALIVSGCADLSLTPDSPASSSTEEDAMFIATAPSGGSFLVRGSMKAGIPNPTALAALELQGAKAIALTDVELAELVTVAWGSI